MQEQFQDLFDKLNCLFTAIPPYGVIYKINFPNGKVYIGQTVQPLKRRISQHFTDNTLNKYKHLPLYRAILNCDRKVDINVEVLALAYSKLSLDSLEVYYINYHKSYIKLIGTNGYNCTLGGSGNKRGSISEATRAKISAKLKGVKWDEVRKASIKGKIISQITRDKIRKGNLGKVRTKEQKLKMLGRTTSEESRERYRQANLGSKNPQFGKVGKDNPNYGRKVSIESIEKRSKLNTYIVSLMREDYLSGNYTYKELAIKYNISLSQSNKIINRKVWVT